MHPDFADPTRRAALFRLFDRTWDGLSVRIERAAALGWRWDEVSTPFVRWDGDVALSHVGVLDLDVLLAGERCRIAGVHAVCTDPDHRREGHYRAVVEQALVHVDARFETAKLSTSNPEYYEPFGFRVVPQHRFRVDLGGDGLGGLRGNARPASVDVVHDRLARRMPASRVFAALDPGWLFGIDHVLWGGEIGSLWDVDGTVVAWKAAGRTLHVYDIVTSELPPLKDLVARSPWPFREVVLWFTPDLVAPGADPIAWKDDDYLMVRGPWPIDIAHAVPPHACH